MNTVKGYIKCLEYNGMKYYSDTAVEILNFKQKDYDAAGNETSTDLVLAVRPDTDDQHFLYDL